VSSTKKNIPVKYVLLTAPIETHHHKILPKKTKRYFFWNGTTCKGTSGEFHFMLESTTILYASNLHFNLISPHFSYSTLYREYFHCQTHSQQRKKIHMNPIWGSKSYLLWKQALYILCSQAKQQQWVKLTLKYWNLAKAAHVRNYPSYFIKTTIQSHKLFCK